MILHNWKLVVETTADIRRDRYRCNLCGATVEYKEGDTLSSVCEEYKEI